MEGALKRAGGGGLEEGSRHTEELKEAKYHFQV